MAEEQFESAGRWWRPERQDRQVPGTLSFSVERGADLVLNGTLRDFAESADVSTSGGTTTAALTAASLDRAETYPRLHGQAGSTFYTLDDCIRTRWSMPLFDEHGAETVSASRVFKGGLFAPDVPVEAAAVSFRLPYLTDWVGLTGLRFEDHFDASSPSDEPRYRIEGHARVPERCHAGDETDVLLEHNLAIAGDLLHSRSVSQDFTWRVESTSGPRPIDDLMSVAADLQALVCLAADKAAGFDYLRFWHPDWVHQFPQGHSIPASIDLYTQWLLQTETPVVRLHGHDLHFTYRDLGGIDGVGRWLRAAARYRSPLSAVVGSRFVPRLFTSDRLLNCTAAIEAFDRSHSGHRKGNFKTRVARCIELAGEPFTDLVGDPDRWMQVLKEERNDVAHHLGLAQSGARTYFVWHSAYYLFVFCILRAADCPAAVFEHMRQHGQFSWLQPRIQSVIVSPPPAEPDHHV